MKLVLVILLTLIVDFAIIYSLEKCERKLDSFEFYIMTEVIFFFWIIVIEWLSSCAAKIFNY